MPTLRIALAQIDPTVGDLAGNARIVLDHARRAAQAGAQLVAFPEMALTGYPVEDLVFREAFVAASRDRLAALAAELAADGLGRLPVLVGYLDGDGPARVSAESDRTRGPRNALAVLHDGRVLTRYFKHHLPNYGVFDEDRYFVAGQAVTVLRVADVDVTLAICEDLWQSDGPVTAARELGAGLLLVVNGSPYEMAKDDGRAQLCRRRAAEASASLAYVNMVGGQDELVFDGGSLVVDAAGQLLARAPQFHGALLVCDLDLPAAAGAPPATAAGLCVEHVVCPAPDAPDGPALPASIAPRLDHHAQVWSALVTGLRDYAGKQGFDSVLLALSGGIDSAVVAAIACDALGADNVHAVSMPSQYSSAHSRTDAADLADRTGLRYRTEPIAPLVDTYLAQLSLSGTAVENLQARVRGVLLMALSNQEGQLVLTTGNKSELAVGYSTLYGDSVGGFNPIKDVPKTLVWQLARWRNADAAARGHTPPIPDNSITKPPSAELRPGQLDSDALPPYEQLDAILADYVDGDAGRADLIAAGHDEKVIDRVLGLVDGAEYKRRQSAPGPKISPKAFGRDRRLPITNQYRHG